MGIERVRYRGLVHPGDILTVNVAVKRLRSRMGMLRGKALVDGRLVAAGSMTFALGPQGWLLIHLASKAYLRNLGFQDRQNFW